ncbi:unnamed protein product [Choristocarpus tenellus]
METVDPVVLLEKICSADLPWEQRSSSSKLLLELVKSQRVRDFDINYDLVFKAVRVGWEHRDEQMRSTLQDSLRGYINIPEFDPSLASVAINNSFVVELCGRFNAGVDGERLFLRDMLYWLYEKFPDRRRQLRLQIGSLLSRFFLSPSRHTHIAEVLEVLRHVVKGFAPTLHQAHLRLLTDILLPLHMPNDMAVWRDQLPLIGTYHEELVKCIVPFIERQPALAEVTIKAVVKGWPDGFESNTPKEVLLLHELSILLRFVSVEDFDCIASLIIPKIAGCLRLENSRVVERALFLFQEEHFLQLVKGQDNNVMCLLVASLLRDGQPFWNPTVTKASMTAHVLETLEGLDSEAFAAVCETLWGGNSVWFKLAQLCCAHFNIICHPFVAVSALSPPPHQNMMPATPSENANLASLKGGMGNWRPPNRRGKYGSEMKDISSAPPVTITGVAPWANQTPKKPISIPHQDTGGTMIGSMSKQLPPTQRLKRSQPGFGAKSLTSSDSNSGVGVEQQQQIVEQTLTGGCGRTAGTGLQQVRAFIEKLKPQKRHRTGPSWQELQMEPTPTLLPNLRFHDLVFGQELGEGSFSVVKYARQIVRGAPQSEWPEYAVKTISTDRIEELRYERSITNEIACLQVLSHPGIARLVSSFRWRDGAFLVLEYASRGDLHTYIKDTGSLDEASTRFVVGEVIAALCSVHDCGFIYGDLKPENILITESGHIKVTDFGACRPVTEVAKGILKKSRNVLWELRDGDWRLAAGLPANPTYTRPLLSGRSTIEEEDEEMRAEGTAAYLPPEVVGGGMPSREADAWALGCVIYHCISGRPPVFSEDDNETLAKVVKFASIPTDSPEGNNEKCLPTLPLSVSKDCRALVGALMEPDPVIRVGIEEAAWHMFFTSEQVDVFSLHCNKPLELVRGSVKPNPDAAWSRRQNSMIWAPMPQEYRCDEVSSDMMPIEETEVECDAEFVPFRTMALVPLLE